MSKRDFRFLAPLLSVHLLNLLFDDSNRLVEPHRVTTHLFDLDRRKPLARILRGLARRLEMSGLVGSDQIICRRGDCGGAR
ncbi:MAG: hypothetical protein ACREFR_09060 [Limisphaerales bacterium]